MVMLHNFCHWRSMIDHMNPYMKILVVNVYFTVENSSCPIHIVNRIIFVRHHENMTIWILKNYSNFEPFDSHKLFICKKLSLNQLLVSRVTIYFTYYIGWQFEKLAVQNMLKSTSLPVILAKNWYGQVELTFSKFLTTEIDVTDYEFYDLGSCICHFMKLSLLNWA